MMIGNKPTEGDLAVEGKLYWWVSCGKNANPSRFFEWGWRGFRIVILRYKKAADRGAGVPTIFDWGFTFWLPVDRL